MSLEEAIAKNCHDVVSKEDGLRKNNFRDLSTSVTCVELKSAGEPGRAATLGESPQRQHSIINTRLRPRALQDTGKSISKHRA